MSRRPIALLSALLLGLSLFLGGPAQAHPRHDVYERSVYNEPYQFEDDGCGFVFDVRGRARGRTVIYNVPGSGGQAFLADNVNRYREVLVNPANGKRLYGAGASRFKEVSARFVEGDVWEFISVERIFFSVLRDARGKVVLREHGTIVRKQLFDTLGDSMPGGITLEEEIIKQRGHLPTYAPDFDFCALVTPLIG